MKKGHDLRRQKRFYSFVFSIGYAYPVALIFSKKTEANEFNLKLKRKSLSCYKNMLHVNKSKKGRLHIPSICWGKAYLNSCKPVMGYIVLLNNSHSSWLIPEFSVFVWVLSGRYLMSVFHFHIWNILFHFALLFLFLFPRWIHPAPLLHSILQI